jgi:hypothetical protein
MIFIAILFSMLSNLVYPAVSSLVSKLVEENKQGEAQGALNGIKALTEGFGPLFFGGLMALYERSVLPGAPYLLATMTALWSLLHTYELPMHSEAAQPKFYFPSINYRIESEEGSALLGKDSEEN